VFNSGPKTWQLLGKYSPGHKIPESNVLDFCLEYGRSQKDKKFWVQDI